MKSKKLRVATVFSGIGAFEQSLKKRNIGFEIIFACDTGERYIDIDVNEIKKQINNLSPKEQKQYISNLYDKTKKHNYVKDSYFANYDLDESRWYDDIRFLDGKQFRNKVDIFVGGSPCQSFSIIGKRGGLEDARGTLFYEYARLVSEIKPKVFIFENVAGMISHNKGDTWKTIKNVFLSLGYVINCKILNSVNYGIPQDRKRLFVVGFRDKSIKFNFPEPIELKTTLFDYLEDEVCYKHYLGEKGFKFVTNPKYKNRARINRKVIQTQKANQQFNWNGDFVFEPFDKSKHNRKIQERAYLGMYENQKGYCRQLSYRECMRLMGYPDSYKIVVPNVPAYRQAGNSIVVNVLEFLVKAIIDTGVFNVED